MKAKLLNLLNKAKDFLAHNKKEIVVIVAVLALSIIVAPAILSVIQYIGTVITYADILVISIVLIAVYAIKINKNLNKIAKK